MPSSETRLRSPRTAVALLAIAVMSLVSAPAAHAAADTAAPTAPGAPTFSQVTPFALTLTWQASTDDTGVSGYLIRRTLPTGGTWVESTSGPATTLTIRDLTPNNGYTFTVVATDAAGNWSAASPAAGVRTLAYTAGSMCSVVYQPVSSGGGSFSAQVAMTNLTPGVWQEWTLGFALASGQRINPEWGFQQSGTRWRQTFVSLWSSGAGPLLSGGTRSVNFTGTYSAGGNPPPTDFSINDHPCTVTGQPVPPGSPVNLTAGDVTPGSVSLTWTAATAGTNPISGYEVLVNGYRYTCVGVNPLGCLVTGLSPGTANAFAVRAVDTAGLVGPATTIVVQTPAALPPTAPGNPGVSAITPTGATLTWTAATPGTAPLAGYVVFRLDGATETPIAVTPNATTTTATLTGLTPGTAYSVRVRARDTGGVLSGPSATVGFSTSAVPRTCAVGYTVADWGNGSGFTATVTVTNTGSTALSGWTLRFSFPSSQRVVQGWNANWTQPPGSPDVTATNLGWNATLQPGASFSIGFSGSYSGANPRPTAFTINAGACAVS
ncbi:fibronectin type III domain-containing protein [Catellatospora sp. KI3]|uniref:cellulose binding domain-containing protein n=1 Tax=Catellatospora sp. KI3 TaxID=3041620 RepID=UPI0024824012|nr:fibronectin type III domain-containing protein [Catellatospora sp. KI3]MDI1465349.1 fibronectin type III domain-containing protein [Catellatospora sp. KI3]